MNFKISFTTLGCIATGSRVQTLQVSFPPPFGFNDFEFRNIADFILKTSRQNSQQK